MSITTFGFNSGGGPEFTANALLALFDAAIKSGLLLFATAAAAWLLRSRSAATVHRVWTLGFCGCLVIPAATFFAPLGTLPVVPSRILAMNDHRQPGAAPSSASARGAAPRPGDIGALMPDGLVADRSPTSPKELISEAKRAVIAASRPALPADAPPSSPRPAMRSDKPAATQFSWPAAIGIAWLMGVAVCVLRSGWQHWSLARLLRRSSRVDAADWQAAVAEASRALGFRRHVELLRIPGARTPAVAGILRTIVLLPGDADAWTADRRQLVLLHELGHAQRRDILTHAVARLVTAVYWFNPLCWLGLIQMGKLRELACDDLVLASGQPPADYAEVLLDVARSYRHRNPGMAVGMARRANVEDRIMAILDRARNRMLLSPQAARRWLLTTAVLVALLGCMRLTPTDESTGGTTKSSEKPSEKVAGTDGENNPPVANDDTRTMQVRITDEAGVPLEKASLHASVWEFDGKRSFPNRDFLSDADGLIEVELPRRLRILRMWPAKHGYVPEFVNFAEGTHDEGKLIPDRYEFQLAKGTELSGTVVDEEEQPISGVSVEVKVELQEPAWTAKPDPMVSTWLTDSDFNCDVPITDTDGKWSINNAPLPSTSDPYKFLLKHTHPNYVKDSSWGELQEQQGVTTAMLRDGTARIILPQGVAVKGTVVDLAEQPVTKGLVIWHDNPYLAQGVNETAITSEGRFETLPLSPGEYPITVVAPGFRPVQRKVKLAKGMDELRFELQPGNRLVLKIVDGSGSPVPDAHVGIVNWGETKALYNYKHSNVPDSGIPRSADENGLYVWDWAPDDAVTYYVSSKGHSLREVTLIANDSEHVIELPQELIASGRVTEAGTGQPVPHFRVIPVTVFRPQFLSTAHSNAVPGKDGQYQLAFDPRAESHYRYQVRIEAPGYRAELSEQSFAPDDGRVEVNFVLERAAARIGVVVDSDGNPVAGASIVQGTPSDVPMMRDGALEHGTDLKSGSDGSFELLATFEPVRIRALHATGFAEVLRQPEEDIGTIQLQPWAALSGQLMQDGQQVADQWVFFAPVPDRGLGEARFQDAYHTQTDKNGRFSFQRLPPGLGCIRAQLGPWQDSPLTSSESVPVNLAPSEQKEITLGGNGISVTGTVNATGRGDVELNKNWSLNYLIRRDAPSSLPEDFPALSFDPAGPVESAWFLDSHIYGWLATRPNYFVKLSPDGQFKIHGVPPGQYDLVLRLYEQPAGCLVEAVGTKVVPVEVTTDDAAAGTKDVGTVDVACRVGPRVGENMQAYEIIDRTGQQRTVQELHGQFVLLHVWASWCAPCIEHMPEIQVSVANWKDRPITVVGLNIDEDRSLAQSLVDRNGWAWAQMYLGDDSDMARQLAISSVPTYYLIGPDGLLAASNTEWSAIRDNIESSIGAPLE